MTIIIGNKEEALKKLLAKKTYDELRELVAELHPDSHLSKNPYRKMQTANKKRTGLIQSADC